MNKSRRLPPFVFTTFIIIGLLIDISIIKIFVFTGGLNSSYTSLISFILLSLVYITGQFFILRYVNQAKNEYRPNENNWTYHLIVIVQYFLIGMFVILILQLVIDTHYSNMVFRMIIYINYCIAIILFGLLAKRFFTWFKNRKNLIIIFYAITISAICFNLIATLSYVTNSLTGQRDMEYVGPLKGPMSIITEVNNMYRSVFHFSSVASYCLLWSCTILLYYTYSHKGTIIRYFLLLTIPLLYFLGSFQPFLIDLSEPVRMMYPMHFGVAYTLFFNAIKPIGGILFGIVLLGIGKSSNNPEFKKYMIISSIGVMILVTSNEPSGLVLIPYPPFGLVTISFLALSSYMFFTGISYSALSVANRKELRLSIRNSFPSGLNFIDDIGTAHMQENIEKTVKKINNDVSKKISRETGVEVTFDEKELKDIVQEIIDEVNISKKRNEGKTN